MRLSRNVSLKIAYILDELIPPIIRDSKWFMVPAMKMLFGKMTKHFISFKQNAPYMSDDDYVKLYEKIDPFLLKRETCLNTACEKKIIRSTIGNKVLEAGCGNAYLAKKLAKNFRVTGVDILTDQELERKNSNIEFINANVEHLPFPDKSFDTVICTHTLEHVLNIQNAIKELRRVTKKRLIVVVPKQKPYKYTFDLHLHFFPHIHSLLTQMNFDGKQKNRPYCKDLGGDLYYQEDN